MLEIYVGVPEDDQKVTVPEDWTPTQVFEEYDVSKTGTVQLNGRTLRSNELNKSLKDLKVTSGDQIYIVQKMDSAQ